MQGFTGIRKNSIPVLTFPIHPCILISNNSIVSYSYPERWRDWPFEASAADLYRYCANSRSAMLEDKKSENYGKVASS
jgi:hypothetical protein